MKLEQKKPYCLHFIVCILLTRIYYTVAVIAAVLFGLGVLISTGMTTTADGQPGDQEKINRQLEQIVKALDSGDIAAAKEYSKETVQGLPTIQEKTQLGVAPNALQQSNDIVFNFRSFFDKVEYSAPLLNLTTAFYNSMCLLLFYAHIQGQNHSPRLHQILTTQSNLED